MENIPSEITENILCIFLPMGSQLRCREVCKTWLTLLPKPKIGLLYGISDESDSRKTGLVEAKFYFSEQNYDERLTKLEHSLIMASSCMLRSFMVGSCNGLVCYAAAGDRFSLTVERKVFICNPITGEHIQAPANKSGGNSEWGIGFGYDGSTNKYKVVRILLNYNPYQDETVQVYTLHGGAVWRTKSSLIGNPPLYRLSYSPSVGVFVGGALHWINQHPWYSIHGPSMNVVAFDLENETFQSLPGIPSAGRDDQNHVRLMELGGILCILEIVRKHIRIWEYTNDDHVSPWVTKFSFAWEGDSCRFENLNRDDDEKCLLWYNAVLSCYDSETKTLRMLEETLKKFMDECAPSVYTTTRATPHVNSLVSLKAIMEKKTWKEKKSSRENRKREIEKEKLAARK